MEILLWKYGCPNHQHGESHWVTAILASGRLLDYASQLRVVGIKQCDNIRECDPAVQPSVMPTLYELSPLHEIMDLPKTALMPKIKIQEQGSS